MIVGVFIPRAACALQVHFLHIYMGWFAGSTKPEEPGALSRKERQKCWETRDVYFACLDREGVVTPGEEGKACAPENRQYEENCARSWVRRTCLLYLPSSASDPRTD